MKYLSLIFIFCLSLTINAQSAKELLQAKQDYKNKEYAKALPIFKKELETKAADPSLNLWYGVCLIETGSDAQKAEECLSIAAAKNIPEAYLYLGDIYTKQYRVSEAEQLYQRFAKARPKDKAQLDGKRGEFHDKLKQAISRTEAIEIIDSLVVDKSKFLAAYNLSKDAGSLLSFDNFFGVSRRVESVVYKNGKDTEAYFGKLENGKFSLYHIEKLRSGYGNEKKLSPNNFELTGNTNYPFVLPDGLTVYFSGEDQNGLGGYDLYITRKNLNNNTYLTPERMNMPFNSTANDYMMVFDEYKGVGWFATDRFLPEGKVCIYTFIPNAVVTLVESDNEIYIENRARLNSIKATWKAGKNYSQLIAISQEKAKIKVEKKQDFSFVINDKYTYHLYSDFTNSTARKLYTDANAKSSDLKKLEKELESKRDTFSKISNAEKAKLSAQIITLENMQEKLQLDIAKLEIQARNEEIKNLK